MPPYPKSKQAKRPEKPDDAPPKFKVSADHVALAVLHHFQTRSKMGYAVAASEVELHGGRRVDLLLLRFSKHPIAVEIKVSRSDWLAEIREPEKHREARLFAGQLYVAAPSGVVEEHELPGGVGLIEVSVLTKRAKVVVKAQRNSPEPLDWWMASRIANGVLRAAERRIV